MVKIVQIKDIFKQLEVLVFQELNFEKFVQTLKQRDAFSLEFNLVLKRQEWKLMNHHIQEVNLEVMPCVNDFKAIHVGDIFNNLINLWQCNKINRLVRSTYKLE